MTSDQALPLRERLKAETRALIADAAGRLFSAHGFGGVTVDAVAQEAGVSRQTVFNHFAVKEDLVFDRAPELDAHMVAAVRDRPRTVELVEAFRAEHRKFWSRLHSEPDPRPPGGFFDLVAASPALQAYARELSARTASRMAEAIAASTQAELDDLRPRVIADALMAVYAATFEAVQRHVIAREPPRQFLDAVLDQADAGLDLLRAGLGTYP